MLRAHLHSAAPWGGGRGAASRQGGAPAWRHRSQRRCARARYSSDANPLEALRCTQDPRERARLLQSLDSKWGEHTATYRPSEAERLIASELGVWQHTVMMFALQTPRLQEFDAASQVKPAVRALKAALDSQDAYFVLTRRPELLAHPIPLQRWLDYLAAQGAGQRDAMAFLLAAPAELFTEGTLHQAGQVVAWLRSLGVKQDFLWTRVVCPCPALLLRDPVSALRPAAGYLMSLGVAPQALTQLVCLRPDALLASLERDIIPFVDYLKGLGCSAAQCGEVLLAAPHTLRTGGAAAFGPRLAALEAAGIGSDDVRAMLAAGPAAWLAERGAPGEALGCLRAVGFTPEQIKSLVTRCPAILTEKPLEIERKVAFLEEPLVMSRDAALSCPEFLAASLMQVIGPRHAFAEARQLEGRVKREDGLWDLRALATGEDVAFVEALGGSINEYEGFRVAFEQEYTSKLSADAALEFQEELKKLGIWEGA